ncbi:AMP-binding protein [Amycolatopsis roodepoortensis]|uniref:Long-chain acyl-CoA synthetase n=1 Tax=Amycolatopsis roodepoortensis TaxID=700274 RepID=A0ABR9LBN1_9PSEU|nr:AMP-binding protein [Amycolatopsis roodepoortensis]MBE1578104.1 long-chain acyl-CoA synthetase [Amycolatopsis roodepoortensis]
MSRYEAKPWLAAYEPRMREAGTPEPTTVLESFLRAVRRSPDVTAIAYFDGRLTYREVDELSDGIARHLLSSGFARGDRLALVLQNIPQFVLALLGAWKAGGIVVPVNPMYRERELRHVFGDAGVRAVVCSQSGWNRRIAPLVPGSDVTIALTTSELDLQGRDDPRVFGETVREPTPGAADLLEAARAAVGEPPPDAGLGPDDVALISYTSGTSGTPKGAMNTHGNIGANASVLSTFSGLGDGATLFGLAPLFHITGMVCEIASAIDIGGTLALAYRFEPGVVLDAFLEHKPVYTVGPSTAYMALMAHPDVSREHFDSFELLYSGGAALPPAVVDAFRARFGHYIHNGYGLTETTAGCIVVPSSLEAPVDEESGTISIGLPVPGTIVRILGEDGEELPFGKAGEIAVEGPMVIPGYWNRSEATEAALPGGRLLTGDVGFMEPSGWVYVVDRKKDMINASGFKVWPREVEDVLYTHPAVREAAVVGIPDEYRGETVKAYISPAPGTAPDPQDLVAYCKERLAAYKYPRVVEVLDELPKTVSGKILRRELRARG